MNESDQWGQVRKDPKLSWHQVRAHSISLCGKELVGPYVDTPPWNGKSCESCLRIEEHNE